MASTNAANSGFWEYSLRLYAQPGVSSVCLGLQDEQGADVNALLFALWAAGQGLRLTLADFALIEAHTRAWRTDIIHRLRATRRALKVAGDAGDVQRLRSMVAAAELEAERHQQLMMEAMLPGRDPVADGSLAADNLAAYATAAGITIPQPAAALLVAASRTCRAFPG